MSTRQELYRAWVRSRCAGPKRHEDSEESGANEWPSSVDLRRDRFMKSRGFSLHDCREMEGLFQLRINRMFWFQIGTSAFAVRCERAEGEDPNADLRFPSTDEDHWTIFSGAVATKLSRDVFNAR